MKLLASRKKKLNADPSKGGWVQVGLMVLSAGLSYLAGRMLADKNKSPLQSDKPTTLAVRGSTTNWFVGIRRVGPVFSWADEREVRKEAAEGGKGGGGAPDSKINYESGWHILCTGACYALHSIIQRGKVIFKGPITAESHPSGTTIDLGKEGAFTIYWGEPGQPINTWLGDSGRVGISSRWPHACYVVWNKKRMSGDAWPELHYELERRPSYTGLTLSQGWYEPGRTLTGDTFNVTSVVSNADEDTGYIMVAGDRTAQFKPLFEVELASVGLPDGTYEVLRSNVALIQSGIFPYFTFTPFTQVFLQGGTLGATATGTMQLWVDDETDGANIAHVMGEMLFADFPLGLQLDPDHIVEKWDLDSLEELGQEAETNNWRASVLGTQGETAEAMLGSMMQDHGVLLPIDTTTGKMLFKRVRFPSGVIPTLVEDIYAESLPEIETIQGEQPVDRLIFSFNDRQNNYGDMTIAVDEDGHAAFSEHQRARQVPIVSTTLFDTAAQLSELRSPEELAPGAQFRLDASREARDLMPGDVATADGFDEVLRVLTVGIDPLSERAEVKVMPDFYGVPLSNFITNGGGLADAPLDPESDEAFTWAEVPEQILASGFGTQQTVLVPRIRNHNQVTFSSIYISRDNTTYALKVNDTNVQTGGVTTEVLASDGPTYVAQSVQFTEMGPDNAQASDYSADLTSWGLGKQLAVIVSSAGTEICFLQKSTITGGSTRRLDGLLRARYDTRKLAHPIGAIVYIINSSAITEIQDGLLEPAEDLWVKSQPGTSAGQVNLSAVGPVGNQIVGKGQVPIQPDYMHVRAPFKNSPCFQTGDNITVSWAISTGTVSTACGFQSAGVATGDPVIPGTLSLELLTTGDVVQDTIAIDPSTVADYEITNAALVAAFGSEPSSFKTRITHVANGHSSSVSPSLTITRI